MLQRVMITLNCMYKCVTTNILVQTISKTTVYTNLDHVMQCTWDNGPGYYSKLVHNNIIALFPVYSGTCVQAVTSTPLPHYLK